MLQIGKVLDGKYRIVDDLAQDNGDGVSSWLVADDAGEQLRLVEVVRKDLDAQAQKRIAEWRSSAEALLEFDHPMLANVVDLMEDSEAFYLVKEYVEGKTLTEELFCRGRAIPEGEAIELAETLCDTLRYLHFNGHVCGYLTPDDVVLDTSGVWKLVGVRPAPLRKCRLSTDVMSLDNMGYSAPECFASQDAVTERSDVYSVGAIMFYAATGRGPSDFKGSQVFPPVRTENPLLGEWFELCVAKAVSFDASNRYRNCDEMLCDSQLNGSDVMPYTSPHRSLLSRIADKLESLREKN